MSRPRIAMRKIREVLRLVLGEGLSRHRAAAATGVPYTTVADCLSRAARAGLEWPLPEGMDDGELEARLYRRAAVPPASQRPQPDWAQVHRELRRKGVTLQLLWVEFKQRCPEGHQYTQFVQHYRQWAGRLDVVLRQDHRAGEKLFLDFPGPTLPITDPETGLVTRGTDRGSGSPATYHVTQAQLPHQPLHRAAGHWKTLSPQLGPHLVRPVDAEVLLPDPLDLRLQLPVPKFPCRRRPGAGRVVDGRRELHHPADRLNSPTLPVLGNELHGLGGLGSSSRAKKRDAALKISLVLRSSRFSRSSSRIRSRSKVVTPLRSPPSTWALRTHRRSVSLVIPNLAEIDSIAAHSEGCSPPCSSTSLTARSRNSCGYLVVLVISPSSQRMESPTFPGRFKSYIC